MWQHGVKVPWVSGPPLRKLEELQAWGEMLKADMVVAYTADEADVHMEGNYWLAHLLGRPFPVPASQVHATDRFEAGWLVVKAVWYKLITTSPRVYKRDTVERLLIVSETIRLSSLKFGKVVKKSPRLGDSLYTFSEDSHNLVEGCVRDQA